MGAGAAHAFPRKRNNPAAFSTQTPGYLGIEETLHLLVGKNILFIGTSLGNRLEKGFKSRRRCRRQTELHWRTLLLRNFYELIDLQKRETEYS